MKAWHFTNGTLRDGSPIPAVGVTLRYDGQLVPCESGLHASERLIDALKYAPGNTLHRVEVGGEIVEHGDPVDKVVARERTILWTIDAEPVLRKFARWCALSVIDKWNAPEIVRRYLETGDEALRASAWDAARAAASAAAWDAARAAAWAAASAAARAAAWVAAWDAARDAQEAELVRLINEAASGVVL